MPDPDDHYEAVEGLYGPNDCHFYSYRGPADPCPLKFDEPYEADAACALLNLGFGPSRVKVLLMRPVPTSR